MIHGTVPSDDDGYDDGYSGRIIESETVTVLYVLSFALVSSSSLSRG